MKQEMVLMNLLDLIVISVESQKGGVGKTTMALNVAQMLKDTKQYEVLLLDLDIAGTEARLAAESPLWNKQTEIIKFSFLDKKNGREEWVPTYNLVDVFEHFMLGDLRFRVHWVDTDSTHSISESHDLLYLVHGKINIANSFLAPKTDDDGSPGTPFYGPSVLFDSAHSGWFMDMIRQLILAVRIASPEKRLAVVIDNSPGFSGLGPAIEEWLTDLGPACGKFLLVNSMDKQDVVASVRAIDRFSRTYDVKWEASKLFRSLLAKPHDRPKFPSKSTSRFLMRMASSVPENQSDSVEASFSLEAKRPSYASFDPLCYYRNTCDKIGNGYNDEGTKWWGVIFNRVPIQIANSQYEYQWKQVVDDCQTISKQAGNIAQKFAELFVTNHVIYKNEFAFLFIADRLRQSLYDKTQSLESQNIPIPSPALNADFHEVIGLKFTAENIIKVAENMVAVMTHLEGNFNELTNIVISKENQHSEHFHVGWERFSPCRMFIGHHSLFSLNNSSNRKLTAIAAYDINRKAHEYLEKEGMAFVDSVMKTLGESSEFVSFSMSSQASTVFISASYLASLALKTALMKSSNHWQPSPHRVPYRLHGLILIDAIVTRSSENAQKYAMLPNKAERWQWLLRHPKAIEDAYLELRRIASVNRRDIYLGRTRDDYFRFCQSQLALTDGSADAVLIRQAVIAALPNSGEGAMAALIDNVLQAALPSRRLSTEIASSYLDSVSSGNSEMKTNPLEVLLHMEVMEEVQTVLSRILGERNWDLV